MERKKIAFIGAGKRIVDVYRNLDEWGPVVVSAVCDPDEAGVRERFKQKGIENENIVFYKENEIEKMLDEIKPDGVMVGTRCNLHAISARPVLDRGIPLFLEKPVGITDADLTLLQDAPNKDKTVVSFPLRLSTLAEKAKSIVDSGVLGPISQIQAVNNTIVGRSYFKKWYRDDAITGGLFLQKATHDIDVIRYVTGFDPVTMTAVASKVIFTGDKPKGLRCNQCTEKYTCPESTQLISKIYLDPEQPDTCSFAVDTGNQDSGTIVMIDAQGRHAVYTQNFVVRKNAGRRQVRIIGLNATLEFNFFDGTLNVYYHHINHVEQHATTNKQVHSGGDVILARNFYEVINGLPSRSLLTDGIRSAQICLTAQQASEQQKFLSV